MHPKILKFLEVIGIYKPIVTPKPPSPLEILQQKLQASGENQELLQEEKKESNAALDELLKNRDQNYNAARDLQPGQEELFTKILEQIQVLEYIDSKTPESPSKENIDKIKKELVKSLQLISRPAKEALAQINDYLETFEEGILLEEARGIYKFKISENDRWVKLPLLSSFPEKTSARKMQAEKEIEKLFQTIPELELLDFANTIPFRPISFIEIEKLAKDKKIATVKTNKSGEVYWCIF